MKARPVEGLDPATPLRDNAALIVHTRLEELRSFASSTRDPSASKTHHDLRIAAKRLRYVLEIVGPCFGSEAKAGRTAARRLQGVLGEIHDCDVMLARVAGIGSLVQLLRTRRELLFRQLGELWQAEEEAGTWAALERSVQARR
jgi:CHAD domain-containing protein